MKQTRNDKIPLKHYIKEAAYYIRRHNKSYKEVVPLDKKSTLMIAHRGLSGLAKENTLPAFMLAGQHSYFGIETDVHKTADGKYIATHDDTTGRVANLDLVIKQTDYAKLRSLRLKDINGGLSDTLYFPTMQEYIDVCKQYGKTAVLELKNHFEPDDIAEIASIIDQMGYLSDTIFISFDLDNLITIRKLYPNQPAQYLTCVFEDGLIAKLQKYNLDLDIYYRELTAKRISLLHAHNIKVNCWTVNSAPSARRLINWGVDYITTNILE